MQKQQTCAQHALVIAIALVYCVLGFDVIITHKKKQHCSVRFSAPDKKENLPTLSCNAERERERVIV